MALPWCDVIWRKGSTLLASQSTGLKHRFIQRRLRRNGLSHASGISTHMTARELCTLYDLSCQAPVNARAVEIGSYLGASTCYIVAGLAERKGHLFCVDTWHNETMPEGTQDTFGKFQDNLAPVINLITVVRKRSDELSGSDIPTGLDFAFIDGDHDYKAVRQDFDQLAGRISAQGTIAFHDCWWFSGVSRVVGEALSSGRWVMAGRVENLCWIQRPPDGQK